MSYLVLARKWRPQTFAEVVGQRPVVRTLQNALRLDRVAHAMLFSGVRGVGKTTLARLMAKALNCTGDGPERPCNKCDSCREITEGRAVDLHEIDGASNRGIQEIRELKENIRFLPAIGRFKIIIIDEVHMLTTEAFNALLKTLEEPPAHVYFMFATTELHKIPITILSRCQRYELTRVSFDELLAFFRRVSEAEGVKMPDSALEMIVREAEGSVRDGLSLLDQIFSFGGEEISDEDVSQVLGLVDRRVFEHLARALLAGDLAACLALFDRSYSAGIDLKRFANDLLQYFRALVICRATAKPEELLDLADRELATLKEIAAGQSEETLLYAFNLLLKSIEEMQYASRPKLVLEMAFVRAAQAGRIAPAAELLGRLDRLLAGVGPEPAAAAPAAITPLPAVNLEVAEPGPAATAGGAWASAPAPVLAQAPALASDLAEEKQSRQAPLTKKATPAKSALKKTAPAAENAPSPEPPLPAAASIHPPAAEGREVRRHWDEFVAYVRERKIWLAPVLAKSAGIREEGSELEIRYDDPVDCKLLEEPENSKLLSEFAQDFFQRELTIRLKIRGGDTLAMDGEDHSRTQRRALADDPLVQMAVEIFNADPPNIRTGPRSR